jgi:hypothetical protein
MEMKFLREIIGKTRRDRIRNDDIREQLKVDDIKTDIEKNRLRWYGHVMRMAGERIPKKTLEMKLRGRRPRGRPKTRWMDQVLRDVEKGEEMDAGETRQGMGRQGQMEISL